MTEVQKGHWGHFGRRNRYQISNGGSGRRNWRCDGGILPNSIVRMESNRKPTALARESGGLSFCLVSEGECPVDPMRMRVDSIMKLDQKSKVKSLLIQAPCTSALVPYLPFFRLTPCALHAHTHLTPQHWLLCHLG